jgi:hypothetical protein
MATAGSLHMLCSIHKRVSVVSVYQIHVSQDKDKEELEDLN